MNKIIAALVGLALLATPALAATNVRSVLYGTGTTEINEMSTIAGFDWTEQSIEVTGYVHEGVKNTGTLYFNNEIDTPGAWEMVESKVMSGTGDTKFKKEVAWWTEDDRTINCGTEMMYPTEAHIFAGFYTETFSDEVEIDNVADLPIPGATGQFSQNSFLKVWDTDEQFNFVEGVGINLPEDCTPHVPHYWGFPECGCSGCPPC